MPAVSPPGGVSGRTRIWAYFITASSLLTQWGGTLNSRSRDACRQLTVRRLTARWPCRRSGASRATAGPAELAVDLTKGRAGQGGDRRHLGCTSDINHWRRNRSLSPALTATGLFPRIGHSTRRSP